MEGAKLLPDTAGQAATHESAPWYNAAKKWAWGRSGHTYHRD